MIRFNHILESGHRMLPRRARVIEKGLVYSPSHGLNAFTVPHFADYMRRSFPSSQHDGKTVPNA